MNVFRLRRVVVLSLVLTSAPAWAESAADPATVRSALNSAETWLHEIDAKKYDLSYDQGCEAFHNKVPHDQWVTILKAMQPTFGELVSRKVSSYDYQPDGYQGLQGECMIIKYDTSFSKIGTDIEVVVMKKEDGVWRGAGYNSQPQGDADEDTGGPIKQQTEVHQEPVH